MLTVRVAMPSPKVTKARRVLASRQRSVSPSRASTTTSRKSSHAKVSVEKSVSRDPDINKDEDNNFGFFPSGKVQRIMYRVMNSSEFVKNQRYDPSCGVDCVLKISDEIRNEVKTFLHEHSRDRYKIVVNVLAGSIDAADMAFVSRSVWNEETDTFIEAKLRLAEKYMIAVLYAVEQD